MLKGFVSGEEKDIVRIPMKVGNEYKEGWEVRDNQDRLIWGREDELQTAMGTLPFKGYAIPVKVKSLLGNAVQNGTPAPDNFVTPEMCGVRTGNLFDKTVAQNGRMINDETGNLQNGQSTDNASDYIPVSGDYVSIYAATTGSRRWGAFYDSSKTYISGIAGYNRSIAIPANAAYMRLTVINDLLDTLMVNLGSTALPYEPYGWKVPFENHGENLFYSDRTNQNTTASSTIDQTEGSSELVISKNETSSAVALSVPINLPLRAGTYTVSIDGLAIIEGNLDRINLRDSNGVIVNNVMTGSPQSFTIAADTVVNAVVFVCDSTSTYTNKKVRIMLNAGSTPKPYSPYLNATIPVYLGEVPTVRRVKKLVLTGEEEFSSSYSGDNKFFYTTIATSGRETTVYSSHFVFANIGSTTTDIGIRLTSGTTLRVRPENVASMTIADFKQWLTQQYAAGHPVTVWYVLANEQTGIVNEPLCKISTYADELTTIQVHGLSAPLYGIGDYKDTLNLSTGVVTRKVKKLVLTGSESVMIYNGLGYIFIDDGKDETIAPFCDILPGATTPSGESPNSVKQLGVNATGGRRAAILFKVDNLFTNDTVFKTWLSQNTPTVWYVLSTPTTETVTVPTGMTGEIEGYLTQVSTPTPTNRSVPKWNGVEETGGTYAVTVYTPPEIPTTTGQNTLTVETEKIHGLTNPLCGIGDYKDVLNLSTGVITRKVKKLVLDGTEAWGNYGSGNHFALTFAQTAAGANQFIPICSHFKAMQVASWNDLQDGEMSINPSDRNSLQIYDSRYQSDTTAFKAWLASEYAAGTPVTVWYVLSTPETETITVPYGLECSVEGYLTQSGTPTPSSPITPDSNGILESGGTYAVEVSLAPSNLTVKGHIKELT